MRLRCLAVSSLLLDPRRLGRITPNNATDQQHPVALGSNLLSLIASFLEFGRGRVGLVRFALRINANVASARACVCGLGMSVAVRIAREGVHACEKLDMW